MSSRQPGKKQSKRKKVKLVIRKEETENTQQDEVQEQQPENLKSEVEGHSILEKSENSIILNSEIKKNDIKETEECLSEVVSQEDPRDQIESNTYVKKSDSINESKLDIGDEDEEKGEDGDGDTKCAVENRNNPKITISEPVNSPCKTEPEQKGRCPIYYGIKSYIHDFYQPPDTAILRSGEFVQDDDFQFLVEPGKRRWKSCWVRAGLWLGVNLMLLGVIALLVGHLTSPRQTTLPVPQNSNVAMVDKWAVEFNNRLIICQLAGLAAFTSGALVVMLALLVYSYQNQGYYVMAAAVMPEPLMSSPQPGPYLSRIPLSGTIRGIQPVIE